MLDPTDYHIYEASEESKAVKEYHKWNATRLNVRGCMAWLDETYGIKLCTLSPGGIVAVSFGPDVHPGKPWTRVKGKSVQFVPDDSEEGAKILKIFRNKRFHFPDARAWEHAVIGRKHDYGFFAEGDFHNHLQLQTLAGVHILLVPKIQKPEPGFLLGAGWNWKPGKGCTPMALSRYFELAARQARQDETAAVLKKLKADEGKPATKKPRKPARAVD